LFIDLLSSRVNDLLKLSERYRIGRSFWPIVSTIRLSGFHIIVLTLVCNVGGLWLRRWKFFENNATAWGIRSPHTQQHGLFQREVNTLNFGRNSGGTGLSKKCILVYKSSNIAETRQDRTKVTADDQ